MPTANVVQSRTSQAVCLPEEIRFNTPEVEIFRRGREVVLVEREPSDMRSVVELLQQLSDAIDKPDDLPPQERDWS